jgi:HD-GYP domain-containing protein (c-di-GMP phosphodiesterase class II)
MVRYNIDDVTDDMILGEAVSLPTGKMLLNAGYRVTERYKNRLKDLGLRSLLIDVKGTEDVCEKTVVNPESVDGLSFSLKESEKKISNILSKFRNETSKNIPKLIFKNRKDINRYIMNPGIMNQITNIIEEILNEPDIVLNLAALENSDDSFFRHAIDIAITSLCIGRKYNFAYDEIKQLGIGALNYHVGLLALPGDLLKKDTDFTEQEKKEFKQHTVYGYLMLSQNLQIPPTSAIVALQHHELQNGTGYPLGLKGSNKPPVKDMSRVHVIHRFAEIVAIADAYHRIKTERSEDENKSIQDSFTKLIKLSDTFLNKEIVKTLISIIPAYPIGTRIRITNSPNPQLNRYIGVVSEENPKDLSHPKILLYETSQKKSITPPIVIDTAKHTNLKFELIM